MIAGFTKLTIETQEEYHFYLNQTEGFIPSSHYFCEAISWDFIFQKYYKKIEGYFCVMVYLESKDKVGFLPPMGRYEEKSFQRTIKELYNITAENNRELCFCEVSQGMKERIEQVEGLETRIRLNLGSSEYLYDILDFQNTFQKKSVRYAYNHILRNHKVEVEKLTPENIHFCNDVIQYFCENHECEECIYGCERKVTSEIVANYDKLHVDGLLFFVEGEVVAFTIVEKKNQELCFHFKKHKYGIRGLNEFIHWEILKRYQEDQEIKWINYTDDMNIPGLRKYKSNLCPFTLRSIYEVFIEKSEENH